MVKDVIVDVLYLRLLGRRGGLRHLTVQYLCLPLVVFRVRVMHCFPDNVINGKSIIIVVVVVVVVVVVL